MKCQLAILGGGFAGLSAGYFARQQGLSFTIFEAADRSGGNCATIRHGEFLFDTGAHRFHDRYPEITAEVTRLLDGELARVKAPSQIFSQGKRIDFPLMPLDLIRNLGPRATARAGAGWIAARLGGRSHAGDFEALAVSRYGRYLAERFLLGYSRKLWGCPSGGLAPEIAGRRLQGLNFWGLLSESFTGRAAAVRHLEGEFLYPRRGGIGAISERLHAACGKAAVRLRSEVTRIRHRAGCVTEIEIGSRERLETDRVISSIPMNELVGLLEPRPPEAIVGAARRLRFRCLVLAALFLDRPQVSENASLYFPDSAVPFTRVVEPKNRSLAMAPAGRTSLVAEIPCDRSDPPWLQEDGKLLAAVNAALCRLGFLAAGDVVGGQVVRLASAYPVVDLSSAGDRERIREYLGGFANLALTGRGGLFQYSHLHDQLQRGKEIIAGISRQPG